jgi:hypothetical membrane protein
MIKLALIYLAIGVIFALLHGYVKEEKRPHVFVAVVTGWPIFIFSYVGAGWDALLNRRQE